MRNEACEASGLNPSPPEYKNKTGISIERGSMEEVALNISRILRILRIIRIIRSISFFSRISSIYALYVLYVLYAFHCSRILGIFRNT